MCEVQYTKYIQTLLQSNIRIKLNHIFSRLFNLSTTYDVNRPSSSASTTIQTPRELRIIDWSTPSSSTSSRPYSRFRLHLNFPQITATSSHILSSQINGSSIGKPLLKISELKKKILNFLLWKVSILTFLNTFFCKMVT